MMVTAVNERRCCYSYSEKTAEICLNYEAWNNGKEREMPKSVFRINHECKRFFENLLGLRFFQGGSGNHYQYHNKRQGCAGCYADGGGEINLLSTAVPYASGDYHSNIAFDFLDARSGESAQ